MSDLEADVLIEAGHPSRPDREELMREHVERIRSRARDEALSEIEAVVRHWETTPALRRGTAAAEMRRALHRARASHDEDAR